MVPSSLRSLHLRAQISSRLMLLVKAHSMAMPSGRGPPLPGASCGCSRHDRGHLSVSSRVWTAFGSRRGSWDGAIAAATARAGYFALFPDGAMGPFEVLAIYRDRDAIERRLGDARSLLGFRTPLASAEDTLAGRLFVTFVALVLAAWLRRRMRETGLDGDYTLEGLPDEVEAIERHAREGHRPRVLGVTPRQEAVFERLGYDPPATS